MITKDLMEDMAPHRAEWQKRNHVDHSYCWDQGFAKLINKYTFQKLYTNAIPPE